MHTCMVCYDGPWTTLQGLFIHLGRSPECKGGDRVVVKLSDVSVTPLWITSGMTTPDGHALLRFVIPP